MGPPQVPEPEKQELEAEVPEPTPTPEVTSRDVTTVTLLLQVPPGSISSSPASPDSSPTSASPEPPLEPAEAQCPASEALSSPKPPPSPPRAASPEPQETPAPHSTERQEVNEVSLDDWEGYQAGELLGLGARPYPAMSPLQLLPGPTEPPAVQDPSKGPSNTKRAGEGPSKGTYRHLPSLPLAPLPLPGKEGLVPRQLQPPEVRAVPNTPPTAPEVSPPPPTQGFPAAMKGNGPQAHSFPQ